MEMMKEQQEAAPVLPHPELAGYLHDEFMDLLKKLDMYKDIHIRAALASFRHRDAQVGWVKFVYTIFPTDAEVGAYFRSIAGVDKPSAHIAKTSSYVVADTLRATGDLTEYAIVKAIESINKYGFQGAAKLVDKAAKRPEAIQGHNFVNDFTSKLFGKIKKSK
jgi:hypothetical protein